jgi:hypothetical protein
MKYINIFQSKFTIYPNWDFWFENKPSGNPATSVLIRKLLSSVKNHPVVEKIRLI